MVAPVEKGIDRAQTIITEEEVVLLQRNKEGDSENESHRSKQEDSR